MRSCFFIILSVLFIDKGIIIYGILQRIIYKMFVNYYTPNLYNFNFEML